MSGYFKATPGPTTRSSDLGSGPRIVLITIVLLAGCAPEPVATVIRPLQSNDQSIESLQVGDVTRPGFRLSGKEAQRIAMDPLPAGTLEFAMASDDPRASDLRARLVDAQGRALATDTCTKRSEPGETPQWHRCRIQLEQPAKNAFLEIEANEQTDTEVLLATPWHVPVDLKTERPPVFIFLIDTARADVFDLCRQDGFAPWLATLAADGVVFDQARTSSPWTRPAIASLFTGLPPWRHHVISRRDLLSSEIDTLAEEAAAAGYNTRAYVTNPNVLPSWGFGQGFDVFEDVGSLEWQQVKADASTVIERLSEQLQSASPQPEFVYAHLMDPHAPLKPSSHDRIGSIDCVPPSHARWGNAAPGQAKNPKKHRLAKWLWPRYTAEVRGMGHDLGTFFSQMKAAGIYDRSVILVVSDHGEEFGEHGLVGHGKQMYEETLHVPAVLKLPNGRLAGTHLASPVQLEDLHRILLEEMGLRTAATTRPPLGVASDETQIALLRLDGYHQSSITHKGWKLILDHKKGQEYLFDLESDPTEQTNLFDTEPDRVLGLQRQLDLAIAEHSAGIHLRFCGSLKPQKLEARLSGTETEPQQLGLEDDDSITNAPDGSYELQLDLTPQSNPLLEAIAEQNLQLAKREKRSFQDRDEILIDTPARSESTMRLTPIDAAGWEVAFGVSEERMPLGEIDLAKLPPEALVPGSLAVSCGRTERNPLLRIWQTPDPRKMAEGQIDPATIERLRALGYAW